MSAIKTSRNIAIVTYLDKGTVGSILIAHKQSIRGFAYILHDKDEEIPHIHLLLKLFQNWNPKQIVKWFDGYNDENDKHINTFAECISDIDAMRTYILHKDEESKKNGKHQYDISEVVDGGLSLFTEYKDACDSSFEILTALETGVSLRYLLRVYGREFLYHYQQYKTLLDDIRDEEWRRRQFSSQEEKKKDWTMDNKLREFQELSIDDAERWLNK